MPRVNIPSDVYRTLKKVSRTNNVPLMEMLSELVEIASDTFTPVEEAPYPEPDKQNLSAMGFRSVADFKQFDENFKRLLSDAEIEVEKQQLISFLEEDLKPYLGKPIAYKEGEPVYRGKQITEAYDQHRKENKDQPLNAEFREIGRMDFPKEDRQALASHGILWVSQVSVILPGRFWGPQDFWFGKTGYLFWFGYGATFG